MAVKPSFEDTLLLRRLKAGETEAQEAFVEQYRPLLERNLRTLAASQPAHIPQDVCAAIVDDAVSHAFTQFFKRLDYIDEANNFLGFLAVTAVRYARDAFEQAQQRYDREKPWPSLADADHDGVKDYPGPQHEQPENHLLYLEAMAELERAVDVLPDAQGMVIRLLTQGLSTAQIAHALGLSEDATESLIRRARIKIVEHIVRQLQLQGLSAPGVTTALGLSKTGPKSPLRGLVEKLLGHRRSPSLHIETKPGRPTGRNTR